MVRGKNYRLYPSRRAKKSRLSPIPGSLDVDEPEGGTSEQRVERTVFKQPDYLATQDCVDIVQQYNSEVQHNSALLPPVTLNLRKQRQKDQSLHEHRSILNSSNYDSKVFFSSGLSSISKKNEPLLAVKNGVVPHRNLPENIRYTREKSKIVIRAKRNPKISNQHRNAKFKTDLTNQQQHNLASVVLPPLKVPGRPDPFGMHKDDIPKVTLHQIASRRSSDSGLKMAKRLSPLVASDVISPTTVANINVGDEVKLPTKFDTQSQTRMHGLHTDTFEREPSVYMESFISPAPMHTRDDVSPGAVHLRDVPSPSILTTRSCPAEPILVKPRLLGVEPLSDICIGGSGIGRTLPLGSKITAQLNIPQSAKNNGHPHTPGTAKTSICSVSPDVYTRYERRPSDSSRLS